MEIPPKTGPGIAVKSAVRCPENANNNLQP